MAGAEGMRWWNPSCVYYVAAAAALAGGIGYGIGELARRNKPRVRYADVFECHASAIDELKRRRELCRTDSEKRAVGQEMALVTYGTYAALVTMVTSERPSMYSSYRKAILQPLSSSVLEGLLGDEREVAAWVKAHSAELFVITTLQQSMLDAASHRERFMEAMEAEALADKQRFRKMREDLEARAEEQLRALETVHRELEKDRARREAVIESLKETIDRLNAEEQRLRSTMPQDKTR